MSIPGNGHLAAGDQTLEPLSESDTEADLPSDYHPISDSATHSDDGEGSDTDPDPDPGLLRCRHLPEANGNGISSLDLAAGEETDEEEEREVREREASVARAISEDERRRRAPLPAGAAARIVEAMRGVAFPGAPPPWAGRVPDAQWLDQLRPLRGGGGEPK